MSEPQEAVKAGWTYAMFNHSMPNLVKIGETGNLEERRKGLSASTSVPTPFIILCAVYVPDCYKLEQDLHAFYSDRNSGKEFFTISHEEVVEKFLTLDGEPWVPAPTIMRDPSVIGFAGGGKHMTRQEKEIMGIDDAAILKRNRDMEVSETGWEEARALDSGFNAVHKQKGYEVKLELIKEICSLLKIPNTFTATDWTHEQWKLFAENVLLCKAVEHGKMLFGYRDERKGGDRSVSANVALKSDLSAIFERWSGSSIVNKSMTHPVRVKVASSPEMPDYTAWSASERAIIKADGGRTAKEISSELGVRWKALKAAVGYIEPKSVRLNSYSLRPL